MTTYSKAPARRHEDKTPMTQSNESPRAPSARAGNRRRVRSHFIGQNLRWRLVIDDAVFALLASLVALGILYYTSNREIGDSMYSAHLSLKETRHLLENGIKIAAVTTFVAVLLFGFWSFIDAHRIVGPMHRMHRLLGEIADGNLTHEIEVRKRDEFQELSSEADRLVDTFAERISGIRKQADVLASALGNEAMTTEQAISAREQAQELLRSLDYFKLPEEGKPTIDASPVR